MRQPIVLLSMSGRSETPEDGHQRGKFELGRDVVPMGETEGEVSLDAPVRYNDPRLAEKVAPRGFGADLVQQHVRQVVHAQSAEDEGLFEALCPGVLHIVSCFR